MKTYIAIDLETGQMIFNGKAVDEMEVVRILRAEGKTSGEAAIFEVEG